MVTFFRNGRYDHHPEDFDDYCDLEFTKDTRIETMKAPEVKFLEDWPIPNTGYPPTWFEELKSLEPKLDNLGKSKNKVEKHNLKQKLFLYKIVNFF